MGKHNSKFKWSILDRSSIIEYMALLEPVVVGQPLPVDQLHKKIGNHIKKHIPIRFSKGTDPEVDEGFIYIGGAYYSIWDKEKQRAIELTLYYNTFQETITLTRHRFRRICYLIADTILHEIIHMRQYRRRKFKDLPDYESTASRKKVREQQEYLGHSDELDAYSFNIACELMDLFAYHEKSAINYLNKDLKQCRKKTNCWKMYLKAFGHDHNHPIIKRVKQKVIRYIPHAINGKPYKNSDWINR